MLCKTCLISLLSQELAQRMWPRDTWNVECCISQLEVEVLLKWAEKITCMLMKWHWFSTDTWTASKCNQILCKSNYWCSILMTTLLPVTFISGSCLISLNEPKVCIPQKGKLSIWTLSHTSDNIYICLFEDSERLWVSNNELNVPQQLRRNHSPNSSVENAPEEVKVLVLISVQNLEFYLVI